MLEMMKLAIGLLKEKVAANLETIRQNERQFQKMLSMADNGQNSNEMGNLLQTNESLLAENFDFINLQLSILKFIENQQSHADGSNPDFDKETADAVYEAIDLFGYTADGKIPFDNKHPLLFDEYFWGRLMKHFYMIDKEENVINILNTIINSRVN